MLFCPIISYKSCLHKKLCLIRLLFLKLTKKFDSQKCVLGKFATLKNFHLILKKSYFTNNYHTETISTLAAKYHEILQKDRRQENTFSLICYFTNIYYTGGKTCIHHKI